MRRTMLAVLAVLAGLGGQSEAAMIFDDFGPGDSYFTLVAYGLGTAASGFGADISQGFGFTPPVTTTLDTVEVAISRFDGLNEVTLRLFDDAGGVPGSLLESFTFTDQMGPFDGNVHPLLSASSVVNPLLVAGQQYWLIAFAEGDAAAGWNTNSIGDTSPIARSVDIGASYGISNNLSPAARLTGTAVAPEPSTFALLGIGATLACVPRLRRQKRGAPQ